MKIVIAGAMKEGKTTIAKLIVDTLKSHGIKVGKVSDPDYESLTKLNILQDQRLAALKNKEIEIEIETIQTCKYDVSNSRVPSDFHKTMQDIHQTRKMYRGRGADRE